MESIVIIFLVCVVAVIPMGYFLLRLRRSARCWEQIRIDLDVVKQGGGKLAGSWRNYDLVIHHQRGGRHQESFLAVTIAGVCGNVPEAIIRKEGVWDQFGKLIGLASELQAGAQEFDDELYIECDNDRFRTVLQDQTIRKLLNAMIQGRKQELILGEGRCRWKTTPGIIGFWKSFSSDDVQRILEAMEQLDQRMENILEEGEEVERETGGGNRVSSPPTERFTKEKLFTFLPGIVIFLAGALLFVWSQSKWGYPVLTWSLYKTGVLMAGVTLLVYLPYGFIRLRGGSRSHKLFLPLAIFAVTGFPMLFCGGLLVSNGYFDTGATRTIPATVKEIRADEGLHLAEVVVNHGTVTGQMELRISKQQYKRIDRRRITTVNLKVSDGFFNEPWVRGMELPRERE